MIDAQENRTHTDAVPSGAPVPAARPLSDFAVEQVGDELVLFDAETMQYHTLNGTAYQIWHRCDGRASAAAIAADLGLTAEVVQETVNDLGVASLLQSPPESWPTVMTRRRATKYIAAGVAGAIGAPIVLSMTAPSHQAAATDIGACPDPAINQPCGSVGNTCNDGSGVLFCCSNGASPVWQDPVASGICANPGWGWDCGGVACPASAGDVQPVALDYVESERVNYAAETEVQVVENVEPEPAVEYVEEVPAEVQYVEEVSAEPQYVEVVEAPVDANADTSVESSAAEPAETPTE